MLADEIRALKPSKKENIINNMRDIAKKGKSHIISTTGELTKEDCEWFCSEGFKVYIDNSSKVGYYSLILIYWGNDEEELKGIIDLYKINKMMANPIEFKG